MGGVYEFPTGSNVWWVKYYENGNRHREKVGRKSDAEDLYQKRKADARAGRKPPSLRAGSGPTVAGLVKDMLETRKGAKSYRNMPSIANIISAQIGELIAADVTPQDMTRWLNKQCRTEATFNRYRASLSAAHQDGVKNDLIPVNTPPDLSSPNRSPLVALRSSPKTSMTRCALSLRSVPPNICTSSFPVSRLDYPCQSSTQ